MEAPLPKLPNQILDNFPSTPIRSENTDLRHFETENCGIQSNEVNKRLMTQLLRYKIALEQQKDKHVIDTLKRVAKVFIDESEQQSPFQKVIMFCLTIISTWLRKNPMDNKSVKSIISHRFLVCLLRIDIKSIIKAIPSIENCLSFLLNFLIEAKLLEGTRNQNLLLMFKPFTLELLLKISLNPKVIYHLFKTIEWMQNKSILTPYDYIHYSIVQNVQHLTTAINCQNSLFFQQGYRILIRASHIENAFGVYLESKRRGNSSGVQAFFSSLVKMDRSVSESIFSLIVEDVIASPQRQYSLGFIEFFTKELSVISPWRFVRLIEIGFIEVILSKWRSVLANRNLCKYLDLTKALREKSKETIMSDAVEDMIAQSLNELRRAMIDDKGEGERPNHPRTQ